LGRGAVTAACRADGSDTCAFSADGRVVEAAPVAASASGLVLELAQIADHAGTGASCIQDLKTQGDQKNLEEARWQSNPDDCYQSLRMSL
jgi:hypothetical protein